MAEVTSLSHIALMVKDIEKMVSFYQEFAGMKLIHKRIDEGSSNVVWLRLPQPESLTIVMIEDRNTQSGGFQRMDHFGFDMASKEDVDEVAQKANERGILKYPAMDGGKILGYFCIVDDPEGNCLEFSYGQMRIEK